MTADQFLLERTGESAKFWMDWIGTTIPNYQDDNPDLWIEDLSVLVWRKIKPLPRYDWTKMDENIACSVIVGLILTLWSNRIIRAKSYDKRRPDYARQAMMTSLLQYQSALLDCIINESHDHEYFPDQEWISPFVGDSHDQRDKTEANTDEDS